MSPVSRRSVVRRSIFHRTVGWLLLGLVALGGSLAAQDAPDADSIPSTGVLDRRMMGFDLAIREFLAEQQIPGAAVAVTDQGRLVFARGYGYADPETEQQVEPASLFRIASVSKPITAVAILTLVHQGKLDLDTPYLEILDLEDEIAAAGDSFDPRQRDVTVRFLLQHRGGWDRDASFDPMFRSVPFARAQNVLPPAGPNTVIAAMMSHKLDFNPGEKYAYSNYGYCLLGRIVEQLSGQTYEEFVREEVLRPMRIRSMRIGATRLAGRAEGEVRYFASGEGRSVFADDLNQAVPHPYGAWYLEAMDAHGGWIASAPDLARFAVALDDPRRCRMLGPAELAEIIARPDGLAGHDADGKPKDAFYGLGWMVRPVGDRRNLWHSGSLPGTATIVIRRNDGRNFVCLLNTRESPRGDNINQLIDRLMHEAASKVETWPNRNLFDQFD